ncbi:VWA domain-containing protein [Sphaerospermopsis aphanizomenoides BCCUSP55]|uniref:vWA domain-containing protein n=1 Tax=Sphaerospermopsis aphanizomenoides TaxID=459663 RepID=UPI000A5F5982|nr:VWA domain-containing protein [Sphaerospermopsis aphanizomenoides]MBK1990936.1 VWA domain-containing protein [Sphaerospermopsis aphanizomenoides BCCUSP55]
MLENRDYTLLIDSSASMGKPLGQSEKTKWLALQESTFALACKCEQFDPDGITVYLFSRNFQRFDHVTSAKVAQIFAENIPADTTNLVGVLQDAINNYFQRKAAGKTKPNGEIILVITDGTPNDRQAVYEVIINATHKMENDQELGISIIQVGADPQATKFLKALDDKLQSIGAKFDICDTITLEDLEEMSLTDVLMNAIND